MGAPTPSPDDVAERDALVGRMLGSTIGTLELMHVYVGYRLGLYRALAKVRSLTASELAKATGINERYAREWLEEQAVAGFLAADPTTGDARRRRFRLSRAGAEVMNDPESLNFLAPLSAAVVGIAGVMPEVMEAFRTGGGVPYAVYGHDVRSAIAELNRPGFLTLLGSKWFPSVPELDARLRSEPPARVADVGCGTGWSSIGIAGAYPLVTVDGLDIDAASIKQAKRNAGDRGVADRVRFQIRDAADPRLAGQYDLVTAFETIHDMSDPVAVLRAMRALIKQGGFVLVADEKVAEEFTAPGDDVERFLYGWSALHCLPVGMVEPDSAGTGTIMRPSRLREYARAAGFGGVEVLPIEADMWRFYRLS
jgi:2-polyprenyl-3-methyl-5-hydroxy-6-metoxy-1,4-benzoquinol methylase